MKKGLIFALSLTFMPTLAVADNKNAGIYVGINAGWDQLNWQNQIGTVSGTTWNRAGTDGTFTVGADLGYAFNQYLALEFGGFNVTNSAVNSVQGFSLYSFKTWDFYLAGKGTISLYENLDLFGKAGIAYTRVKFTNDVGALIQASLGDSENAIYQSN